MSTPDLPFDFGVSHTQHPCPKHGEQPGAFLVRVGSVTRAYCPLCILVLLDTYIAAVHAGVVTEVTEVTEVRD